MQRLRQILLSLRKKTSYGTLVWSNTSVTQAFAGNVLTQKFERQEKPWIGSGICMSCFNSKIEQEEKEQKLIREAQLSQALEKYLRHQQYGNAYIVKQ